MLNTTKWKIQAYAKDLRFISLSTVPILNWNQFKRWKCHKRNSFVLCAGCECSLLPLFYLPGIYLCRARIKSAFSSFDQSIPGRWQKTTTTTKKSTHTHTQRKQTVNMNNKQIESGAPLRAIAPFILFVCLSTRQNEVRQTERRARVSEHSNRTSMEWNECQQWWQQHNFPFAHSLRVNTEAKEKLKIPLVCMKTLLAAPLNLLTQEKGTNTNTQIAG